MTRDPTNTPAFYFDPSQFPPGCRVLIGYQTGAYVVLAPSQPVKRTAIDYLKIADGKFDSEKLPPGMHDAMRAASVVIICTSAGDVDVLKDRAREAPCQGHPSISVRSQTLWEICHGGELPTVDMDVHLGFTEMRAIARAIMAHGPKLNSVCQFLGVTRHCLRRRLEKFGMPGLESSRPGTQNRGLAAFAHGRRLVNSEERSGDLGEQLESAEPPMGRLITNGAPPVVGPDEPAPTYSPDAFSASPGHEHVHVEGPPHGEHPGLASTPYDHGVGGGYAAPITPVEGVERTLTLVPEPTYDSDGRVVQFPGPFSGRR